MTERLTRSQVSQDMTWDLKDLFLNDAEWEQEMDKIIQSLPTVTQFKGKLAENSQNLVSCLKAQEQLNQRIVRVATYASLLASADGSDPINQAHAAKVESFIAKVGVALSFVKSEILALPDGVLEKYLNENKELELFQKYLNELLETKAHALAPETEEALAALGELFGAPYMIYSRSKSSDMVFDPIVDKDGNEHPNSFALYEDLYEGSPDTDLRRKAYASFVKTLNQYKHTYSAVYATEVNKQVVMSRLRKYDQVTDMLLQPQQVTQEMYSNQLDIIQKELAPHMRRYAELKKKLLGLDKMMFCDLKAPLDPEFNPTTTYEEASQVILEALEVMGPEYQDMLKTAFADRWIDRADNIGKSTGAFCSSPYGVHPYILVTWTDSMRSAFTLAHELGHAGHFYLAGQNQTLTNVRPSMYFIEAPSTMNEMLLGNHLLSTTKDQRMRRWVILQLLGTYYHNFVTHLLEGELQRRVYQLAEDGEAITAKVLCEQKAEVLKNFWGDTVEIDEGASLTWMRQPHYYMGLYPYTYSAGLTVSTAVSQDILEEGKPAVERWLSVLKSGGTLKPLDLIKKAGVDMSNGDAIKRAVDHVGALVDELIASYE